MGASGKFLLGLFWGTWALPKAVYQPISSEKTLILTYTSSLPLPYLSAMKQGIKQAKAFRCGQLWLVLVLPLLLFKTTDSAAQLVPKPSTEEPVNSTMPALLGDTLRVSLELQPDSLVAGPWTP